MSESSSLETRAAELRADFDRSFALPAVRGAVETVDVLTVRVAGSAYLIRLRDIAGIVARRSITRVPSSAPHLLGVAGIRGSIVPVFDLASALGHEPSLDPPNWMVLCGQTDPVALGVPEFEGYLRTPRASFHADEATSSARGFVREVVETGGGLIPVIEIAVVITSLKHRAGPAGPAEET